METTVVKERREVPSPKATLSRVERWNLIYSLSKFHDSTLDAKVREATKILLEKLTRLEQDDQF